MEQKQILLEVVLTMYKLFSSLALVAVLSAPVALHADQLNGQFSVDGTVTNDTSTTPNQLEFLPGSIFTGMGTQTGSFATLLADGAAVGGDSSTLPYNPYTPGSFTFDIATKGGGELAVTIETFTATVTSTGTTFGGTVDLVAPGFDPTLGNFSFTTQATGAVTFSATTTAVGTGTFSSPVPEPSTLMLFGTGILGLAGMVRRSLTA